MKQVSNWFPNDRNQFEHPEDSASQRCNWSVRMKFMIALRLSLISHYTHPSWHVQKFLSSFVDSKQFILRGRNFKRFLRNILWPLWNPTESSSAQFPDLKRSGHDIGHEKWAKEKNVLGQTSPHVSHGNTQTSLTFSFQVWNSVFRLGWHFLNLAFGYFYDSR